MMKPLLLKVFAILAGYLLLSGIIIVSGPSYLDRITEKESVIRIGAIVKNEAGEYLGTEESNLLAINLSNHFRKNFRDRGFRNKIVAESYFPEWCRLPGTLLERYKPEHVSRFEKRFYILMVVEANPVESPWDLNFQGCPEIVLEGFEKNEDLPEVKRKTQECLRIDPEKLVKRNFCMAKIFIDYGVFED